MASMDERGLYESQRGYSLKPTLGHVSMFPVGRFVGLRINSFS